MFSILSTAALFGASLLPIVSAAPVSAAPVSAAPSAAGVSVAQYSGSPTGSASTAATSTSSSGDFTLSDGFPNPNDQQLKQIELLAHGTLPNGSPPPSISKEGITNLQLVEFNENFEVAYFTSLIYNITNNVDGFQIQDKNTRDFILEALIAVQAQEELHAINAQKALQHFGKDPILPCKYKFPTTNFDDAINLAATFTDVVLGTLQDVIQIFAQNGDSALTRGVASVVGQEGEQDGFYRILENKGKIPSALPFLTTSTRDFAFSALQGFVVPGSCPNENEIDLKIFGVLNVLTQNIKPVDQNLQFSFDIKTLLSNNGKPASNMGAWSNWAGSNAQGGDYSKLDWTKLTLQYINQQNVPISEKLQNVKVQGTVVTFDAFFPFVENEMNGLTIAAVAVGDNFQTADQVADATLFAPGLIEIN